MSRKLFDIERFDWRIPDSRQRRDALRFGPFRSHRQGDRRMGMTGESPEEFDPRIACRARDPHSDVRIVIHRNV